MNQASPPGSPVFPEALAGAYDPLEPLGSGAMGMVWKARDRHLGREVAIKVMISGGSSDELGRRFRREATTLASIRHPNVVGVYDHGTTPEGPYLVLEFLEGMPIDKAASRLDPLPAMLQVADGLEAIHRAGLVHRDLKPGNILFTKDRRAVIVDFGLVFDPRSTRLTRTGAVVGTLAYMAPEVLRLDPITPASDWYAWGVTLFVLCEGKLPYPLPDILEACKGKELPEVEFARLDPGSPTAELLRRALSARRERRPVTRGMVDRILEEARRSPPSRPGAGPESGTGSLPGERTEPGAQRVSALSLGPQPSTGEHPRIPRMAGGASIAAVALTALGLAGWTRLRTPTGPAHPPTPTGTAPGARSFEDGFAAEVETALEAARGLWIDPVGEIHPDRVAGARPLFEPDPLLWPRQIQAMAPVREFYTWLSEGGKAETLPEPVRTALSAVDRRFAGLGLPEPFWPYAYLGPSPEAIPVPGILAQPEYASVAPPARVSGWLATALRHLDEAARLQDAGSRALSEGFERPEPPPGFPAWLWAQRRNLPHADLWDLARGVSGRPDARTALAPALRPGGKTLHAAHYALARSMREEPGTRDLAAVVIGVPSTRFSAFLYDAFLRMEPELILAGPADHPAEAYLQGRLLWLRDTVGKRQGLEPEQDARARKLMLAGSVLDDSAEAGSHARARADHSYLQWAFLGMREGDSDPEPYLGVERDRVGRLSPAAQATLWLELAKRRPDHAGVRERLAATRGALPAPARQEADRILGG